MVDGLHSFVAEVIKCCDAVDRGILDFAVEDFVCQGGELLQLSWCGEIQVQVGWSWCHMDWRRWKLPRLPFGHSLHCQFICPVVLVSCVLAGCCPSAFC